MYRKIVLKDNQDIFFTSDTHYGHKNICQGVTEWDLTQRGTLSCRPFSTLDAMNDTIVRGINNTVAQDDILVHLGDWSFGGIENIWKFRERLMCKNIILVNGNHDHHIINNRFLPNGPIVGRSGDTPEGHGIPAQELFDGVYDYLELTVSAGQYKRTFNLMHFPIAVWNKAHKNRIHLHGHTHASYIAPGRALDVGIDSAYALFGEYTPFSLEEIQTYMEGREYTQQSHHDKFTN